LAEPPLRPVAGTPDDVAETLCRLPLFRPVALRVLQAVSSENADVRAVTELIQTDAAFSAEVLHVANSPLFGFGSQISTISHGLVVLGLERIRSLTATTAFRACLQGWNSPLVRQCWSHSFACAQIARELSTAFRVPKELAYTAGLVHDLGRLGLLAAYRDDYATLLEREWDSTADVLTAENDRFQANHCSAGSILTRVWNFPGPFQEAAMMHHDAGAKSDCALLVQASCRLSDSFGWTCVRLRQPPGPEEVLSGIRDAGATHRRLPDLDFLKDSVTSRMSMVQELAPLGNATVSRA
jgi:HD-like signal output (HDOD) protein